MSEIIQCPECGQSLRVQRPVQGSHLVVKCAACRTRFDWPVSHAVVAVQRGNVIELNERRNVITTHREPLTLEEFESFGRPLARVADPTEAEWRSLHFRCSRDGTPFTPVVMKDQLGMPFRLVSNGRPNEYVEMARRAGCVITPLNQGVSDRGEIDLTGFLCGICGFGIANGDKRNSFYCPVCENWFCARSVIDVQNGPATARCPVCKKTYEMGGETRAPYASSSYFAERPNVPDSLPQPIEQPRLLNRIARKLLK